MLWSVSERAKKGERKVYVKLESGVRIIEVKFQNL